MARILVVDDNEQVIASFREILIDAGHEVEGAQSVVDALSRVVDFKPDLVLLDLSLGPENVGGTVGAFALKGIGFSGKVVVVTGGMDTTKQPLRDLAPVDGKMLKPVTMAELLTEVNKQLGDQNDHNKSEHVS